MNTEFKTVLPPRKRAKTSEEKEQRRIERILRNRRAAHQSREKKRKYVEYLENYIEKLNENLNNYKYNQELMLTQAPYLESSLKPIQDLSEFSQFNFQKIEAPVYTETYQDFIKKEPSSDEEPIFEHQPPTGFTYTEIDNFFSNPYNFLSPVSMNSTSVSSDNSPNNMSLFNSFSYPTQVEFNPHVF